MARVKRPPQVLPEISQASTADIAFLLLIFFISTTVFETEFGISMRLPPLGGKPVPVKRENVLTIRTDAEGAIYVDDAVVTLREVRNIVKGQLEQNVNLIVSIESAGSARYERMIDILDEVKMAKAPRISIKKHRG
jgi:biopolymer transport protein ExbD